MLDHGFPFESGDVGDVFFLGGGSGPEEFPAGFARNQAVGLWSFQAHQRWIQHGSDQRCLDC